MPYPPLMYWALAWTRWVSFPAARWLWAAFIVATLLSSAYVWSRHEGLSAPRWATYVFGALLVAQFPATFAIERGNNDAVVVLLWTGAVLLFARGRHLLAGSLAGLAAAAKLYPAFGAAVLLCGVVGSAARAGRAGVRPAARFAAGLFGAPAIVTVLFRTQTAEYLGKVLPAFAAHLPGVSLHSHSVPATFGGAASLVSAMLVVAWCAAAFLRMDRAPALVFAGALAVSTYVARTSFDYNLVTAYPLLLVCFARARDLPAARARWAFLALALGLVAIAAHRAWFVRAPHAHVVLQVLWLLAAATLTAVGAADAIEARAPLSAAPPPARCSPPPPAADERSDRRAGA
jgi:hypothetical protein